MNSYSKWLKGKIYQERICAPFKGPGHNLIYRLKIQLNDLTVYQDVFESKFLDCSNTKKTSKKTQTKNPKRN